MEETGAISVIDGRYLKYTRELSDIFSEHGLIRHRVYVEVQWLKFLLAELELDDADSKVLEALDSIAEGFGREGSEAVKEIEKTTNHDVKAVEYYIKDRLCEMGLSRLKEWVHFACTSDDINNCAYALMVKTGRQYILDQLLSLLRKLEELGREYKSIPMISRTHGQPATPTTLGKEMVNFAWRLRLEYSNLRIAYIQAKMNGASGNFCAHSFVYPEIDWISASQEFISGYLGLAPILLTTQINPNSYLSEILHILVRTASIVVDLDRDMWGYISLGYFRQKHVDSETGSSTMPHKVNPIDFENSEGNMGIAISIMEHMAVKLLNSRFQRDLTDSTVLRNLGSVFGYLLIGFKSTLKGLERAAVNREAIARDIEASPEILAEAVQTVMRACKEENPYEKLKTLTRGRSIDREKIGEFIETLENIPPDLKKRLVRLKTAEYTGLSERLVDWYFSKMGLDSP